MSRARVRITKTILGACLACVAMPATGAQAAGIIVRRDAGLSGTQRADVRADAGVRFQRHMLVPSSEVVNVPLDRLDEALEELNADPRVRYAEPDGVARAQTAPVGGSDTYWSLLWGLHNTGASGGVADADVDAPEAWATGATGTGVMVAVVDTGVKANHEDLIGQLATDPGEQGGGKDSNGVDDDGDGLVDNWRGWDWVQNDNDPDDLDSHGTHVSGTIAAINGNNRGVSGLAPGAKVLPLRVLDEGGSGAWSDVADAFAYAGGIGVPVVNASLGGEGPVQIVSDAIAAHPNTLYVVAAGNEGVDLDTVNSTPCEAAASNVVCVGATTRADVRASFSNHSESAVDLMAPGASIASSVPSADLPQGDYEYMSGTSMATPHVAAQAALVLDAFPTLSVSQLKSTLLRSTDSVPALAPYADHGRANAAAALADTDADAVPDVLTADSPAPPPPPPAPTGGEPSAAPTAPPTVLEQPASEPRVTRLLIRDVAARAKRCPTRRRCGRATLTVTASVSDGRTLMRVQIAQRRCRDGACRWVKLGRPRVAHSSRSAQKLTAILRSAGRYRLTISAGDAAPVRRTIRVR